MFIYFQFFKNGQSQIQAFHKLDKAADYVINQIETYIANDMGPYKKKKVPYGGAYPQPAAAFMDDLIAPAPLPDFGQLPAVPAMPQPVVAPPPQGVVNNIFADAPYQSERKVSAEMVKLRAHMEVARKNRTFDNAILAIKLYEEYAKYVLDSESAIHTLEDIRVAE